jgi:EpsI family protein
MRSLKLKTLLIGLVLVVVAGCELLLKPTKFLAEHDRINLSRMIPERFAAWHQDDTRVGIVNAQTDSALSRLYDQNLVRTYVNADGQRIMLNVAYGRDQGGDKRLHPPEICYRSQGFMISETRTTQLNYAYGALPIQQFVGNLGGARREPVTYWVSYGDVVMAGATQGRLARLHYVFRGLIPDGILFRVSSINNQENRDEFALHERFIKDLIASLSDPDRSALIKSSIQ